MGKKARSQKEIEDYKRHILKEALDLIVEKGYDNFSMRKLAGKLGVSATSIYDYFENKEVIYINILIVGFDLLRERIEDYIKDYQDPKKRFKQMAIACLSFGIEKKNLYNLMFQYDAPKYNDFVGTEFEELADKELKSAMTMKKIIQDIVVDCRGILYTEDNNVTDVLIKCICVMHGFISFYNSDIVNYIFDDIDSFKSDKLVLDFIDNIMK